MPSSSLSKIAAAGGAKRGSGSTKRGLDEVTVKQEKIDAALARQARKSGTQVTAPQSKSEIDLTSPDRKKHKERDRPPEAAMTDAASQDFEGSSLSSDDPHSEEKWEPTEETPQTPPKNPYKPPAKVSTGKKDPIQDGKQVTYAESAQLPKKMKNKLGPDGKPLASIFQPKDNSREHSLYAQCRLDIDPSLHPVKGKPSAPQAIHEELGDLVETINSIPDVDSLIVPWVKEDAKESNALIAKGKLPSLPTKRRLFFQGIRSIKNDQKGGMTIRFRVVFNGDKTDFLEAAAFALRSIGVNSFVECPLQDASAVRTVWLIPTTRNDDNAFIERVFHQFCDAQDDLEAKGKAKVLNFSGKKLRVALQWKAIQDGKAGENRASEMTYATTVFARKDQESLFKARWEQFRKSSLHNNHFGINIQMAPCWSYNMCAEELSLHLENLGTQKVFQERFKSYPLRGVTSLDKFDPLFKFSIRVLLHRLLHPKAGTKLLSSAACDSWRSGFSATGPEKWSQELAHVADNIGVYVYREAQKICTDRKLDVKLADNVLKFFDPSARLEIQNTKWDPDTQRPISANVQMLRQVKGVTTSSPNRGFFEGMDMSVVHQDAAAAAPARPGRHKGDDSAKTGDSMFSMMTAKTILARFYDMDTGKRRVVKPDGEIAFVDPSAEEAEVLETFEKKFTLYSSKEASMTEQEKQDKALELLSLIKPICGLSGQTDEHEQPPPAAPNETDDDGAAKAAQEP